MINNLPLHHGGCSMLEHLPVLTDHVQMATMIWEYLCQQIQSGLIQLTTTSKSTHLQKANTCHLVKFTQHTISSIFIYHINFIYHSMSSMYRMSYLVSHAYVNNLKSYPLLNCQFDVVCTMKVDHVIKPSVFRSFLYLQGSSGYIIYIYVYIYPLVI